MVRVRDGGTEAEPAAAVPKKEGKEESDPLQLVVRCAPLSGRGQKRVVVGSTCTGKQIDRREIEVLKGTTAISKKWPWCFDKSSLGSIESAPCPASPSLSSAVVFTDELGGPDLVDDSRLMNLNYSIL